jgi:hypothetical protein
VRIRGFVFSVEGFETVRFLGQSAACCEHASARVRYARACAVCVCVRGWCNKCLHVQ